MSSVLRCLVLTCVLLSGCAATHRSAPAPLADASVATVPGFPAEIRWVGETRVGFSSRAPQLLRQVRLAAGQDAINVLVLSGGGSGGAFGAGALVGWSQSGTRPDFQIVTGVSAGALMAPLAFLGSDWDGELKAAFAGERTRHLLRAQYWGALFGSSLYSGAPLVKNVDQFVTDRLVQAVARESRKGRLLLVATTDLDREQTVYWNLGLIAEQGGERARRLFRDVLVASASVPGVFPPVMIRVRQGDQSYEEMHVDGSAIASLFFVPDVAAILPAPLEPLRAGHLYILINGRVTTVKQTTPDQTLSILKRSALATLQGSLRSSVELAYSVAQQQAMSMTVAQIPNAYPSVSSFGFHEHAMGALFDYGMRCGRTQQLWVPALDALDPGPSPIAAGPDAPIACPSVAVAPAPSIPGTLPIEQRPATPSLPTSIALLH